MSGVCTCSLFHRYKMRVILLIIRLKWCVAVCILMLKILLIPLNGAKLIYYSFKQFMLQNGLNADSQSVFSIAWRPGFSRFPPYRWKCHQTHCEMSDLQFRTPRRSVGILSTKAYKLNTRKEHKWVPHCSEALHF